MDLKLAIIVLAAATTAIANPVPPNAPKYVPVFVSSDALNRLDDKDGQSGTPTQPAQSGSEKGPNSDYDIKKDIHNIFYGPPAPVYEHQPDQQDPSYSPPALPYPNNKPQVQQQYQNIQPQPYPVNQQPTQNQQYQQPLTQSYPVQQVLPNQPTQLQQYQVSQPTPSQPVYQISQQPAQQAIMVTQQAQQPAQQAIMVAQRGTQPLYGNQQQIIQQPLGQQTIMNPQPFNQQQLVAQPFQTYQQPNQQLIGQPAANQPILISQQSSIPNQQAILLQQPNQNRQLITSNQPINIVQPNNQGNPGYIQNQNQNVYAVVPLNGQNLAANQNVGTSTYLVPVQQLPNQVFAVNSGS